MKSDLDKMPAEPDPMWPTDAIPLHLSVAQRNEVGTVYSEITDWKCSRCGKGTGKSHMNEHLCSTCYAGEAQNSIMAQKVNANWMDEAKELGLELFERQPEENDTEWRIWDTYRNYYPNKLPTYAELAAKCGCAAGTVVKAATKWSFRVRLIAWVQYTDAHITEERKEAVQQMNKDQLSMAKTMSEKVKAAIELINVATLKPGEIVNLAKLAFELERKIVTYVDVAVPQPAIDAGAAKMTQTKPEDLGEVISILREIGKIPGSTVGLEQTTRILLSTGGNESGT